MGGEAMADSWFGSFWRTTRKTAPEHEKAIVGILAFEIVSSMSKLVCIWHSLSDKQVDMLREGIVNSPGVKKLVSEDEDYLLNLALAEIIETLGSVVRSVSRLGKKCVDPIFHHVENFFDEITEMDLNWCGWNYRLKKMERKVKKMERFVAVTAQLQQELEVLAELEQTLRRMKANIGLNKVKYLEFQQKVEWQRQEVRALREMSPWARTFDYTTRLLIRSIVTVLARIKNVFENQLLPVEGNNDRDSLPRSHSFSAVLQSSVHPSENSFSKAASFSFKNGTSNKQLRVTHHSSSFRLKNSTTNRLVQVGPFKGCMPSGAESPIMQSCMNKSSTSLRFSNVQAKSIEEMKDSNKVPLLYNNSTITNSSLFSLKRKLLNAPPCSLGDAALAHHYANIIIYIERVILSSHFDDRDVRDDLYNKLPTSLRSMLRARLKVYTKTLDSSLFDAALEAKWRMALGSILEWLAPLAHNMIRWQSERSFEKQSIVSGANVLLVQTLFFANREKTEAAITEVLVGLNYIWRFGREDGGKAALESGGRRAYNENLLLRDNIAIWVG